MSEINLSTEVSKWCLDKSHAWVGAMKVRLKLPEQKSLSKAVITLETPSYVGSATVWGGGTLEIVILDLAAKREVLFRHSDYNTSDEMRLVLDDYLRSFVELTNGKDG